MRKTFRRYSFLALAALFMTAAPAGAEVLDRIIVVVNEGVILQSELDDEMGRAREQISARGIASPPESVLRAQVLERLMMMRVQMQRAQQAGIRIDDRELNEVLTNIARQNNVTLAEFADQLRKQGMDYLAAREQLREELTINRLRQREVDSRVSVTDQDIELFLASHVGDDQSEFRLSHLLVAIPDGASPEQREQAHKKAQGLVERARAGEDFASLAIANSDGQQALQGGDLDWRKAEDLPTIFAQAAAKLEINKVSDVLETAGGFHIIKLVGKRGTGEAKTINETHSRHILIQANTLRNEEQATAQIRDLKARLDKGEDFAKLAKEFSDDPGSKNGGGDLGWQPPGVFAPEFQQTIDGLKDNEISGAFHTQFGWHIAQVLERRTRDVTEQARRGQARASIQRRKAAEEYDTWLRRLREEAYVEYRVATDAAKS
jgi:peptidyl-prolyl cis-trans isomerase SurA